MSRRVSAAAAEQRLAIRFNAWFRPMQAPRARTSSVVFNSSIKSLQNRKTGTVYRSVDCRICGLRAENRYSGPVFRAALPYKLHHSALALQERPPRGPKSGIRDLE